MRPGSWSSSKRIVRSEGKRSRVVRVESSLGTLRALTRPDHGTVELDRHALRAQARVGVVGDLPEQLVQPLTIARRDLFQVPRQRPLVREPAQAGVASKQGSWSSTRT